MKALFLDRDGTVSEEVGYINHISRLIPYPWTAEAIRLAHAAGYKVFLVTNQAGAARGYFPFSLIDDVHRVLQQKLADQGAQLDGIYYCPHHPDAVLPELKQDCACRKPRPGMLLRAAEEHGLNLEQSWMIGDRYMDIQLAHSVGARAAFVLTGYGRGEHQYEHHRWPRQPEIVAENLMEAVQAILSLENGSRSRT
jgi:D-glycero-D-manno-heptose 1,7-bisphosphate phosphatase